MTPFDDFTTNESNLNWPGALPQSSKKFLHFGEIWIIQLRHLIRWVQTTLVYQFWKDNSLIVASHSPAQSLIRLEKSMAKDIIDVSKLNYRQNEISLARCCFRPPDNFILLSLVPFFFHKYHCAVLYDFVTFAVFCYTTFHSYLFLFLFYLWNLTVRQ